ncbi:MAG TPA: DUF5996 family protein [Candidatus Elarobacter sp.]|jgi:hypothetical protein|nr:DUF5996 family protein [Candidatus Elarobacter sp.]
MSWDDINVSGWAPTKRSLHLYAQMLGKLRVELSPRQPNWMFTLLHLDARGLTTGAMPYAETSVEALLDVFSSEIIVRRSTGDERRIALMPPRTVADVYGALHTALAELGIACTLWPIPQEIPDVTPLNEDTRAPVYDPAAVQRWFRATTAVAGVFDQWREHFFGRSGVQLWWGAFDVSVMLFNGRHAPAPLDRGYLLKYDLDAELMNVGLYYGDENTPPFFYGYIFPQPAGAEAFAMAPASVTWSDALKEWVLPYDTVRAAADPGTELRAFLDAVYARCISDAGWDRAALSYDAPPKIVRDG